MSSRRPRAQRRAQERAHDRLARDREQLARLSAGGSPGYPIEVESASLIEPRASSLPCARCEGAVRVQEHRAELVDGVRLRSVEVGCGACGARRTVWFRLISSLPS